MATLILLRHGQSLWNKANRFTGWVDVPLSQQGIEEAMNAGKQLAEQPIDIIFISTLMRAQQTAMLAMVHNQSQKTPCIIHQEDEKMAQWTQIHNAEAEKSIIPCYVDWRLNERYYGELQGANKAETIEKYGADQVKIWRRSYDIPPPEGESLQMTAERTLPCLNERIIPALQQGKNCLVAAHGNSLRSIVMSLEKLSSAEVLQLELPTGIPRLYKYTGQGWQWIK